MKKPNSTMRESASKFGVSATWIHKILAVRNLKAFRVHKSVNRTDQQVKRTKTRSRRLYDRFLRNKKMCVILDDETYVVADLKQFPGHSFYRAFRRFAVARQYKYQSLKKFPEKYMIWQAICSCGKKSQCYLAKGNMRAPIYIQECLEKRLLPLIKSRSVPTQFWPDLASIHYSKMTLDWFKNNNILFVPMSPAFSRAFQGYIDLRCT